MKRTTAIALLLVVPASAHANAAMSMALATFDFLPWLAYVGFTVLFEAALIGRMVRMPFPRALCVSFCANFVTAIVGIVVPCFNILAYTTLVGTRLNPNPLLNTAVWFAIFGLLSASVESIIWLMPTRRWSLSVKSPAKPVFLAHLLGIPLGLAILLIPARPYPGLEGRTSFDRSMVRSRLLRELPAYAETHGGFPSSKDLEEVLVELSQFAQQEPDRPDQSEADVRACAYQPNYGRFDLTENRQTPFEWHRSLAGKKLESFSSNGVWIARLKTGYGIEGYYYADGRVQRIFIPEAAHDLSPSQQLLLQP